MGGIPDHITKRLKLIVEQTSGKIEDNEQELVVSFKIKGTGATYCLLSDNRTFVKVERGTTVYVVQENYSTDGKTLIYSQNGDILLVDPDELVEIGFD
jgi:tricorn protease-like protein